MPFGSSEGSQRVFVDFNSDSDLTSSRTRGNAYSFRIFYKSVLASHFSATAHFVS